MAWSVINPQYYETIGFSTLTVLYTNDTGASVIFDEITLSAGTAVGKFGKQDDQGEIENPIIGDGTPIMISVIGTNLHYDTLTPVSITHQITRSRTKPVGEDIYIEPEYSDALEYVLHLSKPTGVEVNQTYMIQINVIGAKANQCLVLAGVNSPAIHDQLLIQYNANGGQFIGSEDPTILDTYAYPGQSFVTPKVDPELLNPIVDTFKLFNNYEPLQYKEILTDELLDSWNTKPDGSGDRVEPDAEYSVTEETILYAIWKHDSLPSEFPSVSRNRYFFLGWNTKPDGSGREILPGSLAELDLEVYAMWIGSPIHVMTENGWQPWFLDEHTLENVSLVKSAHREGIRDISWRLDKPVYMYTAQGWKQIHNGSKYPTLTSDEIQPMLEPTEPELLTLNNEVEEPSEEDINNV